MQSFFEIVFWVSLVALAWAHVGFVAAVWFVAASRRRRACRVPVSPRASVVLVAGEWDDGLEERLTEVTHARYPEGRLEVLVAPAGGPGRVCELIERLGDDRVRFVPTSGAGPAAARNRAALQATGDVLVFLEPGSLIAPDAVRALVQRFADPRVGMACGARVPLKTNEDDFLLGSERLWAAHEAWRSTIETRAGCVVPGGASLWAIRRDLWLPAGDARDAGFAAAIAVVGRGHRCAFEPRAVTWQRGEDAAHRFRGRVRRASGGLRVLHDSPQALSPLRGFQGLAAGARALRWLTPALGAALLVSAVALCTSGWIYAGIAATGVAALVLAAWGWATRRSRRAARRPWLSLPLFAGLGCCAALVALARAMRRPTPGSA